MVLYEADASDLKKSLLLHNYAYINKYWWFWSCNPGVYSIPPDRLNSAFKHCCWHGALETNNHYSWSDNMGRDVMEVHIVNRVCLVC